MKGKIIFGKELIKTVSGIEDEIVNVGLAPNTNDFRISDGEKVCDVPKSYIKICSPSNTKAKR